MTRNWWSEYEALKAQAASVSTAPSRPAIPRARPGWQPDRVARFKAMQSERQAERLEEKPAWASLVRDARAKAGSISKLAAVLGVTESAICYWMRGVRMPPGNRKAPIEAKLMEFISR